jgi:hypothetical protein
MTTGRAGNIYETDSLTDGLRPLLKGSAETGGNFMMSAGELFSMRFLPAQRHPVLRIVASRTGVSGKDLLGFH